MSRKPVLRNLSGNTYGSHLLAGYSTRPLREAEFHNRVSSSGSALDVEVSYTQIPVMSLGEDGDEEICVESWPLLLPSQVALGS